MLRKRVHRKFFICPKFVIKILNCEKSKLKKIFFLKHPTTKQVTVEDVVPLHKQTVKSDPTRMKDPDATIHPDSETQIRYVMGTRLQGNLQKSHKLKTCQYHNIDLATNCGDVKTMTQESMQNVRRHRTIQADKLRSIECSFLANVIVDFKHNEKKTLKQRQSMLNSFKTIERDPDTWRMVEVDD